MFKMIFLRYLPILSYVVLLSLTICDEENEILTDDGAFQVSFEILSVLFQVLGIHRHHPAHSCIWSGVGLGAENGS